MTFTDPLYKRDDRGVVAIEFVLLAPWLIALIMAIASFGAFFLKTVEVTGASRAAARELALGKPLPSDLGGATPSVIQECDPGVSDASVTLTTKYKFSIPLIDLGEREIKATGTMRCGG